MTEISFHGNIPMSHDPAGRRLSLSTIEISHEIFTRAQGQVVGIRHRFSLWSRRAIRIHKSK